MKIAALLPHVEIYGGVRRYLEIGNALARRGHRFVLHHPTGEKPGWLEFLGETKTFSGLGEESFDIGLCSEYSILPQFDRLNSRAKFFYFVLEGHKKEKETAQREFHFLGNSEGICRRIERRYGVSCLRAPGGVNPEIFHPLERGEKRSPGEFRVLSYGRIYKRRKGILHVIRAAERLGGRYPGLRLIFFDSRVGGNRLDPRSLIRTRIPCDFFLDLPQSRMSWLFSQADVFVSSERRAGWANTAAEAMACRVPVVCTPSGTRDFAFPGRTALVVPFPSAYLLSRRIDRLIKDPELCHRLAQAGYEKIREFTWEALAVRLEAFFREKLRNR